jgi:DNA-binding MarR family transcriptional regulator
VEVHDHAAADPAAAARTVAMLSRVLERGLDDMTLAQFRVLSLIVSSPERASRVAERAAMSRPSLTGLLDGLAARGWVRRVEVDGDRRGVGLEVTAAGRTAHDRAARSVTALLDEVIGELEPDRQAAARDGLDALGAALRSRAARRLDPAAGTGARAGTGRP